MINGTNGEPPAPPTAEQILEQLRFVVKISREYWDQYGEPYPPAIQAAIDFLKSKDGERDES